MKKIFLLLCLFHFGCFNKTQVKLPVLNSSSIPTLHVSKVIAGLNHTCILYTDSTAKCFGLNSDGQLGKENTVSLGDNAGEMGVSLTAINLGSSLGIKELTGGQSFSCAVLTDDSTKCWGDNWAGMLGQGDVITRGDDPGEMGNALPIVNLGTGKKTVQLASGYYFVCALLNDASVKCWGKNPAGQLGQGHTNSIGDNALEMGDSLSAIDLGTGKTATQITAGGDHACAILNDGSVKCWGYNSSGQLGLGHTNDLGDNALEMGDFLSAINLGTGKTAIQIAAGREHTCALLNDASVKCWGNNDSGQLGKGNHDYLGDNALEMGDALLPINLGTGRSAVAIAAREDQSCALLDNKTLKCWGENFSGALGQEASADIGDDPGEMGDALMPINLGTGRTVLQISAGAYHLCALLDNYRVKCWGLNSDGQLGLGHTSNMGDNVGEMGNALSPLEL